MSKPPLWQLYLPLLITVCIVIPLVIFVEVTY